jgi:nucleolar protein 14
LALKLKLLLAQARLSRRWLELHHHKPLAIKMQIPKFEENFNPDRHYDPDKERTEAAKLKKEHKREKKGAIRELRKDANILAVQSLREKKERDAAYEKKYKRLVAEIQGEEGKEAKAYEREKEWRKKGRK